MFWCIAFYFRAEDIFSREENILTQNLDLESTNIRKIGNLRIKPIYGYKVYSQVYFHTKPGERNKRENERDRETKEW